MWAPIPIRGCIHFGVPRFHPGMVWFQQRLRRTTESHSTEGTSVPGCLGLANTRESPLGGSKYYLGVDRNKKHVGGDLLEDPNLRTNKATRGFVDVWRELRLGRRSGHVQLQNSRTGKRTGEPLSGGSRSGGGIVMEVAFGNAGCNLCFWVFMQLLMVDNSGFPLTHLRVSGLGCQISLVQPCRSGTANSGSTYPFRALPKDNVDS